MLDALRRRWNAFRSEPAGTRFQRRYRRSASRPSGWLRKCGVLLAATVLIVLGLVMLVLPGPGLLALLLGAVLIAEESRLAARLLDRVDFAISRGLARRTP